MSEEIDAIGIGFASRSTSLAIATGFWRIAGWSIWESAGTPAAAQFRVRDGTDTSGAIRGGAKLAASGNDQGPNFDEGIRCIVGVYLEVVAGSIEGCVYLRAD